DISNSKLSTAGRDHNITVNYNTFYINDNGGGSNFNQKHAMQADERSLSSFSPSQIQSTGQQTLPDADYDSGAATPDSPHQSEGIEMPAPISFPFPQAAPHHDHNPASPSTASSWSMESGVMASPASLNRHAHTLPFSNRHDRNSAWSMEPDVMADPVSLNRRAHTLPFPTPMFEQPAASWGTAMPTPTLPKRSATDPSCLINDISRLPDT
ncbi:hypothetical protein K435DRAFT_362666, partial [Dendrothele bispora CBS 962.96]